MNIYSQAIPASKSRPTVEPYFNDLAELYERFIQLLESDHSPVRRWLLDQLPGGTRGLDVGCGGGRNCALLAARYDEVLGVDIAQGMLDLAIAERSGPNIRYECRSVFDLSPERDGRFDAVISVNSVFHMGPPETVLSTMRNLVAPGGRLVIIDVVLDGDWDVHSSGWQVAYAFDTARMSYLMSGSVEMAADAIRLMLHPRWQEMSTTNLPLTPEEFQTSYANVLPGVEFGNPAPTLCSAVWTAPAEPGR
jgi:SAM-dependent methyltransferase